MFAATESACFLLHSISCALASSFLLSRATCCSVRVRDSAKPTAGQPTLFAGSADHGVVLISELLPPLRVGVGVSKSLFERFLCPKMAPPSAGSLKLIQVNEALQ